MVNRKDFRPTSGNGKGISAKDRETIRISKQNKIYKNKREAISDGKKYDMEVITYKEKGKKNVYGLNALKRYK